MTTMTTITIPSGPLQGVKLQVARRRWGRAHTLLSGLGARRRTRSRITRRVNSPII